MFSHVPLADKDLASSLLYVHRSNSEKCWDAVLGFYKNSMLDVLPVSIWKWVNWPPYFINVSDFPGPKECVFIGGKSITDLSFAGQFMTEKCGAYRNYLYSLVSASVG